MKNKGLLSWMLVLVLTLTACGGKDPATSKPAEGSKPAESTTVAENSTAASAAPAESTAPEESAAPVESQESQASVDPAGTIPAQGEKPQAGERVLYGTSEKGMGGEKNPLKVEVTLEGPEIKSVKVVSHGETAGIADKALQTIPEEIVKRRGTEGVQAVSGATMTSEAIIEAVINALKTDKEDNPVTATIPESVEQIVLTGTSEKGMGGAKAPLKVEVTMQGTTIVDVKVVSHGETPGISDEALKKIPEAIVEKRGTEGVDAISGATLTSEAIIEAVQYALATH